MKIERIKDCITPQIEKELTLIGRWPSTAKSPDGVPVYHVSSPQAFNQVIGYAKFINRLNCLILISSSCCLSPGLRVGARRSPAPAAQPA